MLTCIRMQNLIKIYHVVQELLAFSLNVNRRTYRQTDSHSDYSAHLRVVQYSAKFMYSVYVMLELFTFNRLKLHSL